MDPIMLEEIKELLTIYGGYKVDTERLLGRQPEY